MALQNKPFLNCAGGEISPEVYGRIDLPIYQRGYQRIQNYEVLPNGGYRYRNGFAHVHNTAGLNSGRLISFAFNQEDTFILEFTNGLIRFYRDFEAVTNTPLTITGISNANPCVVTSASHGLSNGQEVFITGIANGGPVQLNNQWFLIANVTTNTFSLENIFGDAIDSTNFGVYSSSGGTAATPYEISSPYILVDLNNLHVSQSADVIYITNQNYMPYKLSRESNTDWTIAYFERTADPFGQQTCSGATQATVGVFTTPNAHNFKVGDPLYFDGWGGSGWTTLNRQPPSGSNVYTVNTVPTTSTFTVALNGTPLNTSGFGTPTLGDVIDCNNTPKTLSFTGDARLNYFDTLNNPTGIWGSQEPDSTTGVTQFDNFTTGANDNDSYVFTLASVFNQQDAIQAATTISGGPTAGGMVVCCANSCRIVTGSTAGTAITPSSINAPPVNNIGAAPVQPYSNGQSVMFIDQSSLRLQSFIFNIQVYNYASLNQNLISNQLSISPFILMAQQRRESSLLWILRADGVLMGWTFDEVEGVYGWHRHYAGGSSVINGTVYDRANVLSIAVQPQENADSVLWVLVERQLANGKTYRSVEYWTPFVLWVDQKDFYSGDGFANAQIDQKNYYSAQYEQTKQSCHLDCSLQYDGSKLSTVNLTPSAATGTGITITADGNFFDATMVGRQIWKAYNLTGGGGGRAQITAYTSPTEVTANVLVNFDNANEITNGSWYLTTSKLYGQIFLAGEIVTTQIDGAPGPDFVVADDGSIYLGVQASVVYVGYPYLGMMATMNMDLGGVRGSAQAKPRKIEEINVRFIHTMCARVGTTQWNTWPFILKDQDQPTDRPTQLYDDVYFYRPEDDTTRLTKQVFIIQDIPAPQTVLSLDVMMLAADDD